MIAVGLGSVDEAELRTVASDDTLVLNIGDTDHLELYESEIKSKSCAGKWINSLNAVDKNQVCM